MTGTAPRKAAADAGSGKDFVLLIVLLAAAVGAWFWYWNWIDAQHMSVEARSAFGEMFGGINALFSAFAFVGLIATLVLQRRELGLQRQELADTREELQGQKEQLARQREEMEKQNRLLARQAFETAFYELLRFQRQVALTMSAKVPNHGGFATGESAFQNALSELTGRLSVIYNPPLTQEKWLGVISMSFNQVCLTSLSDFGHYFRTLYHLIRLVDDNEDVGNAYRYVALIRAQLSNAEMGLLFLDGLSDVGREKLKPLLEKYAFFKPLRLPPDLEKLRSHYSDTAYLPAPNVAKPAG